MIITGSGSYCIYPKYLGTVTAKLPVFLGDNLHKLSDPVTVSQKNKKNISLSSAEFAYSMVNTYLKING